MVKLDELLSQLVLGCIDNFDLGFDFRLGLHDLGREFGYFWKVVSLSGESGTDFMDLLSEGATISESHGEE